MYPEAKTTTSVETNVTIASIIAVSASARSVTSIRKLRGPEAIDEPRDAPGTEGCLSYAFATSAQVHRVTTCSKPACDRDPCATLEVCRSYTSRTKSRLQMKEPTRAAMMGQWLFSRSKRGPSS